MLNTRNRKRIAAPKESRPAWGWWPTHAARPRAFAPWAIESRTRWCCNLLIALAAAFPSGAHALYAKEISLRQVTVLDDEGRSHSGLIAELAKGDLTLVEAGLVRLPQRKLVHLKFDGRGGAINPADPFVLLANGDRLVLRVGTLDDEALLAEWVRFPRWQVVRIPLETVRGMVLVRSAGAVADARLLRRLTEFKEPRDAAILMNGDSLLGELSTMNEKGLTIDAGSGPATVDRAGIRAVALNGTLSAIDSLKGEGALVTLTDGSRFHAQNLALSTLDDLACETLFGAKLRIPVSAIQSLRFLGGCATYLSDLDPADYKSEAFLDLTWPWRRDHNVLGGVLKLRGIEYPKGIGVHGSSEIVYPLAGKYRRFQSTVGIDDETAGLGSVAFEVLLDGQSVARTEILAGTSSAVTLSPIDVSRGKVLVLRTHFATQGDIQDHADWCDAVLIK